MYYAIIGVLAVIGGFFVGYYIRKKRALSEVSSAEARAEKILNDAKAKQKELMLAAQDKALKIIEEAKREDDKRRQELSGLQARLEKRETVFSQKLLELQDKQQQLYDKVSKVEEVKEKIKAIRDEQLAKLEKIASMTREEAKQVLFKNVESEIKDDLVARINKLEKESSESLDEKARDLMSGAMQRLASTFATEITTTTVDLPNDEMKGRIIGREGRNIKVIEQLTGVEIIVDDTPNAITISGFSPIRRHVAKRTLTI